MTFSEHGDDRLLAMLRETVQRAYYAALMRKIEDRSFRLEEVSIAIEVAPTHVVVSDHRAGTTVTAELEPGHRLTADEAGRSLDPYVRYLPVRVTVNGKLVSRNNYRDVLIGKRRLRDVTRQRAVAAGEVAATIWIGLDDAGRAAVEARDIRFDGRVVAGEVVLAQGHGAIMGMRHFFGIGPLAVATFFELGGVANLSSMPSQEQVAALVAFVEAEVAAAIADSNLANRSNALHRYIVQHGRYDLAGRVVMDIAGCDICVSMQQLPFYRGRARYVTERYRAAAPGERDAEVVLVVSTDEPRRQIQLHCLREAGIPQLT